MRRKLKKINHNMKMLFNKKKINAIWYESKNWGDALNPVLIQRLSGLKPFLIQEYTINPRNEPIYMVIGSFLQTPILTNQMLKNTVIWGSGFISDSGRLQGSPQKICAVRGPLTRENILKTGIKCPEVYGDPALLYSKLYRPNITKKYKLGIIPHYFDKENDLLKNFKNIPEINLIDIEGSINSVIDQICSCKYIASSSLHGIIAADTYDIPSVWIKFSDNVIGEGFKFRDYFKSVNRLDNEPLIITEKTTVDNIFDSIYNYEIDIDLNELLDVCPFYNVKL
jgi:pyruvyltransferase